VYVLCECSSSRNGGEFGFDLFFFRKGIFYIVDRGKSAIFKVLFAQLLDYIFIIMSLTRKVAQRKAVRSQKANVLSQLDNSIADDSTSKAQFLGLKNNLSHINVQLNHLDEEILQLIDPDSIEDDVTESMTITQPIYGILAEVELKLEKNEHF